MRIMCKNRTLKKRSQHTKGNLIVFEENTLLSQSEGTQIQLVLLNNVM